MNLHAPRLATFTACAVLAAAGCQGQSVPSSRQPAAGDNASTSASTSAAVSGRLEGGLRLITLDPADPAPVVRVYRGDYVQLAMPGGEAFTVTVDSLKQSWTWPVPEGGKPYLKMAEAGRFAFVAGAVRGTFEVIEYQAAAYRELTAAEAVKVLVNLRPFVLDVRTPGEYADGHLEGAMLLPVQQLQQRLGELRAHADDPVLIYCHSGNRSTVAAKLLIDAGFTNVMNLRRGTIEWKSAGLPLVK